MCEHSRPLNRKLHFIGTASIVPLAVAAIFYSGWLWILIPFSAYGFAWYGHFFVEKNKPATFIHPVWSLIGDFRMFGYMLIGRMDAEVQRCLAATSATRE